MGDLIASQKVMQSYLSALLLDEEISDEPLTKNVALDEQKKQELNALLAQVVLQPVETPKTAVKPVSVAMSDLKNAFAKTVVETKTLPAIDTQVPTDALVLPQVTVQERLVKVQEKDYRKARFQALFFNVAGLKVAVPLKELGAIHKIGPINSLFGKPAWFKGIMLYREQKMSIVDTARWVMPEKYDQELQQKLNYQYVIMLGSSHWGLCCESLVNTYTLEPDDVKWRESEGKRPWMAGVIKEHMCVLLDVDAMIDLLNRGLDINA